MNNEIALNLGEKSYKIKIGAGEINYLPKFLQQKNYSKIFIITDENVAKLHLAQLESLLKDHNISSIKVAGGEQSKSFAELEKTCEKILQQNVDRKSLIIAFGGGVVGDLAGFIASILLRGIDFVQVPTTLLACVDSSVGGKTAINSKFGKNLLGSFYQPKLVICDLDFLATLPQRQFRAGYAEALKYGLIDDAEFFDFLDQNLEKIFINDQNGLSDNFLANDKNPSQNNFLANKKNSPKTFTIDQTILQKIITKSCQIKAKIVSQDEKESGVRALLNFGHTFAHSFENELNYSNDLLHGEAVGIGMLMAAKMSQNLGMIDLATFNKIKNHIEKSGLNIDLKKIRNNWNQQNLANHLYRDKKTENQNLTFILLEKIGKAAIKKSVNIDDFTKIIADFVG